MSTLGDETRTDGTRSAFIVSLLATRLIRRILISNYFAEYARIYKYPFRIVADNEPCAFFVSHATLLGESSGIMDVFLSRSNARCIIARVCLPIRLVSDSSQERWATYRARESMFRICSLAGSTAGWQHVITDEIIGPWCFAVCD